MNLPDLFVIVHHKNGGSAVGSPSKIQQNYHMTQQVHSWYIRQKIETDQVFKQILVHVWL